MSCFIYFGHFYQLAIEDDDTEYSCRSTLEIVSSRNSSRNQALARRTIQNPSILLNAQHPPDAVVVMLNPGGSRPCDGQEPSDTINPCQIDGHARSNLVLTRPDDTQKAVEKVMTGKQFDHVRVLNLFDIREPDSAQLVRRIRDSLNLRKGQSLLRQTEIRPYSIFSNERRDELINRLNPTSGIVVVAWGVGEVHQFFEHCYQILEENVPNIRIHGWQPAPERYPIEDRRFHHPARKKHEEWSSHIVGQLTDV